MICMAILEHLEPKRVFYYFEQIAEIPHGSGDTKAISDYCAAFAKKLGLRHIQDDSNNVVIFKDGTPGYEDHAPVILQGHLDMVCEKEADCTIDFEKDGLSLILEDNVITADGTTLGGDDGIAVAYCMAILEADNIPHPPLEVVFTTDEEIGMFGAADLDTSVLQGRTMLNIDSEEEGYLLVSCAGGVTTTCHLPIQKESASGTVIELTVTGLLGGHSGVEIDKGRANANHILGRILFNLSKHCSFRLVSMNGGLKDNAIPRQSTAELVLIDDYDIEGFVTGWNGILSNEFQTSDPDIELSYSTLDNGHALDAMTADSTNKAISLLYLAPCGVIRMSPDIDGLVQTSLNLGILATKEDEIAYSLSLRSSIATEKEELMCRLTCLAESLGGTVTSSGDYPAWEYKKDSPLRELMVQVYKEQTGKEPVIQALHAGLECGLFSGKLPGLDCISFGPDMKDIHTPMERMYVDSVQRVWMFILEVLKRL